MFWNCFNPIFHLILEVEVTFNLKEIPVFYQLICVLTQINKIPLFFLGCILGYFFSHCYY